MSDLLEQRVGAMLGRRVQPEVLAAARALGEEANALAVLFYGSNLRSGSFEGVLDFYVLLPGSAERGLWPRVSYLERDEGGGRMRAKVATMTLAKFAEAAAGHSLDTTIWARFVQPCALVWQRDDTARAATAAAIADAARTAARLTVVLRPAKGTADDFWRALFRATYRAELRIEPPGRADTMLAADRNHFAGLLPAALGSAGIPYSQDRATLAPRMNPAERRKVLRWWRRRRRLGKALNAARLVRAAGTFDGAARYAAWKIERHTGVPVELTAWRERHPVLAAPAVLWNLWRRRKLAR